MDERVAQVVKCLGSSQPADVSPSYRQFTCARCGSLCSTETTEAEANRELLESGLNTSSGISSVCDDCYEYLMMRADGLP